MNNDVVKAKKTIPLEKYNDLLTVADMAEVLQVSTRTIYRLIESGELCSVRIGRRLYFPKDAMVTALGLGA